MVRVPIFYLLADGSRPEFLLIEIIRVQNGLFTDDPPPLPILYLLMIRVH